MAFIGCVNHLVTVNLTKPHIVALAVRVEDIHCDIRITHLAYYCSKCSITHVNSSVFFWGIAHQWFCTLKGVDVVFKNSHHFILIEVRHPMEKSIEVPGWITVEGLADGVNGNVVANKFKLILIVLEGINHEVFLIPILCYLYPSKWWIYPESNPINRTLAKVN
jgi:hypothetical protein